MRNYIELNSKNLLHNLKLFHSFTRKNLMFVVKANAYGHGLEQIVKIVKNCNFIKYFVVDSIDEALEIRRLKIKKPILVIGWTDFSELKELISRKFETVVASEEHLKQIYQISKKISVPACVHMKIETGTTRLGFDIDVATRVFQKIPKNINIRGIYSHFANIEDTTDPSYAYLQISKFESFLKKINHSSILKHFSCSASTLLFPETYYDLVRIGISAYGYWPSKQIFISFFNKKKCNFELKKVLSWHTKIAQIKSVKKGTSIGYGLTYKTFADTKIGVIPVGYYDGYDRRLSNIGRVIIKEETAPIRGRICMNMSMVDVNHINYLKCGDTVILLGQSSKESIDANSMADLIGTINYEILSRINPVIPRVVI